MSCLHRFVLRLNYNRLEPPILSTCRVLGFLHHLWTLGCTAESSAAKWPWGFLINTLHLWTPKNHRPHLTFEVFHKLILFIFIHHPDSERNPWWSMNPKWKQFKWSVMTSHCLKVQKKNWFSKILKRRTVLPTAVKDKTPIQLGFCKLIPDEEKAKSIQAELADWKAVT